MFKKLIISAVVLGALIVAKESRAAGPAGFARTLASAPAVQILIAENGGGMQRLERVAQAGRDFTAPGHGLAHRLALSELDRYFDGFAAGANLPSDMACKPAAGQDFREI